MRIAHLFIDNLLRVLKNDAFFDGVVLTKAYENTVKPYPVRKPVMAFSLEEAKVGDKIVLKNPDGTETVTKDRLSESIIKVSIFVPFQDGIISGYRLADHLYSLLLFQSEFPVTGCHYGKSHYVRECAALLLETTFTLVQKETQ